MRKTLLTLVPAALIALSATPASAMPMDGTLGQAGSAVEPATYYGYYGGYGSGYGSGYGYGSGSGYYSSGGYGSTYRDAGSLRLKIRPREAQVFVDGYFVGVVDSFDGVFQSLKLDGGGHNVEIKAEGFEPLDFEVLITPGETVTYKGEMKRIQ